MTGQSPLPGDGEDRSAAGHGDGREPEPASELGPESRSGRTPQEPEPTPAQASQTPEQGGGLLVHGAGLVRATALDLAVLAGHVLLYPTGMLPERAPGAAASHRPVLLIHGFVDNRSAFTFLRRSLQHHGWSCVQSVNYSPLTSDVRAAAAQLGPRIEAIRARTGHASVDIVAHSLGGLIARHYVQCQGGDAAVRTLVTLGTPHAGTRAVPALTPHPLARQMRPGSAVLRELAGPAPGCRTRFVAFWSDLDQLMIPAEAARLEHTDLSVTNIRVSGVGHLALPVHGSVAAQVRRELAAQASGGGTSDAA